MKQNVSRAKPAFPLGALIHFEGREASVRGRAFWLIEITPGRSWNWLERHHVIGPAEIGLIVDVDVREQDYLYAVLFGESLCGVGEHFLRQYSTVIGSTRLKKRPSK